MVYASCFECGDVEHKWIACPHRQQVVGAAPPVDVRVVGSLAGGSSAGGSGVEGFLTESSVGKGATEMRPEQEAVVAVVEQKQAEFERRAEKEVTEDVEAELLKDSLDDNTNLDMEDDSGGVSVADSGSQNTDIYSLEEINTFLDETLSKPVRLSSYFPDGEK